MVAFEPWNTAPLAGVRLLEVMIGGEFDGIVVVKVATWLVAEPAELATMTK